MSRFKTVKDAYLEAKKYCKADSVAQFPSYVTFSLTNMCNFKCRMCHLTYIKKDSSQLDFELFKKAVDEIARYGSLVRFIGYEEPFLYRRIGDAISYVKEKGLLLHITTNGSLLDMEMMKKMVDNGVDSIIFSFQGLTPEEYCSMRDVPISMYDKLIGTIRELHKMRQDNKPYIKVTTTITERDDLRDKGAFMQRHIPYADEVQITGFTHVMHIDEYFGRKDIWDKLDIGKPERLDGIKCFAPNFEMIINYKGDAYPCCGVFTPEMNIGNIGSEGLLDIWRSEKAARIRSLVQAGKLDGFNDCAACPIKFKYPNIKNTVANAHGGNTEKYCKEKHG